MNQVYGRCDICNDEREDLRSYAVFGGDNFGLSFKYDLIAYLCPNCYGYGERGIHNEADRRRLRERFQRRWMRDTGGSARDFEEEFGINCLKRRRKPPVSDYRKPPVSDY